MIHAAPAKLSKDFIHQGRLEKVIKHIFPGEDTVINARKESKIKYPSGAFLELDIWIPKFNISFEFQDDYHYISTWYMHVPLPQVQERDAIKNEEVRKNTTALIPVPCWWDGSARSLKATVHFHCPELFAPSNRIIPLNPPIDYFDGRMIPDVGEVMLASFPSLQNFAKTITPQNTWWMGEKYDGVRACWNGYRKLMLSRNINRLHVSKKIMERLPKMCLDCELWFGRGNFHEALQIVGQTPPDSLWPFLRLLAFDKPDFPTQNLAFESRYKFIVDAVPSSHPIVILAARYLCSTRKQLMIAIKHVIKDGGEGVILRKPKTLYERGRTQNLIKLKASRGDKEALVLDINSRSILLQLPEGNTFEVPAKQKKTLKKGKRSLARGDVVTFEYYSYSHNALPVRPKLVRIRSDLSWGEVIRTNKTQSLNEHSRKAFGFKPKASRSSTAEKRKNMRVVLEKYAKTRNLDPLLPDTWYNIARDFVKLKEARKIRLHFGGSFIRAVLALFPNIGLEPTGFSVVPKKFWADMNNRRNLFCKFAKLKNFDPLIPENWYPVVREDLVILKGAATTLEYYNGTISAALVHLFPDIGLDATKFNSMPRNYWDSTQNRRQFFEKFAEDRGFNPLVAENWYSVRAEDLLERKEGKTMQYLYQANLGNALIQLFPEVPLSSVKLHSLLPSAHWQDPANQRHFFESFARDNQFDPLVPENWYTVRRDDLMKYKNSLFIKVKYNGNFVDALQALFSEIRLNPGKFTFVPKRYWANPFNQKQFLDRFAKDRGFDPLVAKNWYSITSDMLLSVKGGWAIWHYHKGGFANVLQTLYPSIGLDATKFGTPPKNYWNEPENRKKFFMGMAADSGFDPLLPENWYLIRPIDVRSRKGGSAVLAHYNHFSEALLHLFPNIGLDPRKIFHWKNK
eukprot:Phypoly_transcript_01936.p1 GENE.Phypoly_transcript_01936~~Phypoly_transcript_01936.p1  ORF type:complete len:910 (+),score=132.37 Phypoly_transcript_01936:109-2838(+)